MIALLTADEAARLTLGVNAERVLERIDARGPCWIWTGAQSGGIRLFCEMPKAARLEWTDE